MPSKVFGAIYLLAAMAITFLVLFLIAKRAPSELTIATSFKGGSYELFALRYRDILARDGVQARILNTSGSGENLRLLAEGAADIALIQGGFSDAQRSPQIVSLGRVGYPSRRKTFRPSFSPSRSGRAAERRQGRQAKTSAPRSSAEFARS
jgi:hypothetical protein